MKTFENFVGNSQTVGQIQKMLACGTFPHAVVISGKAGSGKKTLAGIIAAALVCEDLKNGRPCGICPACQKARTGHPDIVSIIGDKKKVAIGVEYIREMRTLAYVLPSEAKRKVYIISRKMNDSAQNALLKVLEEPPKTTTIIILAESKNDLLETVLSRSTVFELGGVDIKDGVEYLSKLYPKASIDLLREKLCNNFGIIGAAMAALDDDSDAYIMAEKLASALTSGNRVDFLTVAGEICADKNSRQLCDEVITHLASIVRDAIEIKYTSSKKTPTIEKLSYSIEIDTLTHYHELINEVLKRSELNPNLNLTLTVLCSDMFD